MFRYNPLVHEHVRLKHNLTSWSQWATTDSRVRAELIDSSLPQSGLEALEPMKEPAHCIRVQKHSGPKYFGNIFGDEAPADQLIQHDTAVDRVISSQEARQLWSTPMRVMS